MIPVELEMKNFLSYLDQVLDLEGIHVAAICGRNGTGKSSLLEAILFSLYGEGRYAELDRYIHEGQQDMAVKHTFILGGDKFRIIRGRSSRGGGKTLLEFYVENKETGDWQPVYGENGDKSPKAVQARIRETLHLDVETFTSSAFIMQGLSDSFSRQKPAKRTETLMQVLNLEFFVPRSKAAAGKATAIQKSITLLKAEIEQQKAESGDLDSLKAKKTATETLRGQAAVRLVEQKTIMEMARTSHAAAKVKADAYEAKVTAQTAAEKQLQDIDTQIQTVQNKRDAAAKVLEKREVIEAKAKEHADLSAEVEQLQDQMGKRQQLQTQVAELTGKINTYKAEKRALEDKAASAVKEIKDRIEVRQLGFKTEAEKVRVKAGELNRKIDARKAVLQAAITQAQNVVDGITSRTQILQEVGCEDQGCPLLQDALQAKAQAGQAQAALNQAKTAMATDQELQDLAMEVGQLQDVLAEKEQQATQVPEDLAASLAAAEKELQGLITLNQTLLENGTEWTQALASAQTDLADRPDVTTQIQEKKDRIQELQPFVEAVAKIPAAAAVLAEVDSQLEGLKTQKATVETSVLTAVQEVRVSKEAADQVRHYATQIAEAEAACTEEETTIQQYDKDLGQLEEAISRATKAEGLVRIKEKELADQEHKAMLWEALAEIYGKKGIPKLLIENSLPELEERANEILRDMTNGKMRIRFDTQRAAKSSDAMLEVLDIMVIPESGMPRPYEGFSGGQRFRIDFALRVGLSELLAKRAGARIELLVVDEGLGSQDEEGRAAFLDAIRAVSRRFQKILVVSHISEILSAFDTTIETSMDAEGVSSLKVS